MPVTCSRCGEPAQPNASACVVCGHFTAASTDTSLTITFPAEQTLQDLLLLEQQATAPVLVPSPPSPPVPPPVPPPVEGLVPGQRTKTPLIAGAAFAVVGVIVTAALLATSHTGGNPVASAPTPAEATGEPSTSVDPPTTSSLAPIDESSARQLLDNEVANDRTEVQALTGSWVPQLSSKRPGRLPNGAQYDYQAIWSDFASLRERYPGVLLLWSGDYSSFASANFWVTIFPQAYASGSSANSWCDAQGIGADDCYAKRIANTGTPKENTQSRK